MSQINVQILHQEYTLSCPDGHEDALQEAVERVNNEVDQIRTNGRLRSRERAGMLVAVNMAFENLALRAQMQTLQQQLAQAQHPADEVEDEVVENSDHADELASLNQQLLDQQAQQALLEQQTRADAERVQALIARLDAQLPLPEPSQPEEAEVEATAEPAAEAAAAAPADAGADTGELPAEIPAAALAETSAETAVAAEPEAAAVETPAPIAAAEPVEQPEDAPAAAEPLTENRPLPENTH